MSDSKRRTRTAEEILAAAGRVFAERGFRGATMQAIAEAAGCTVPTLYAHFDGKRAILRGLVEQVVADLLSHFERPMPAGLSAQQTLELLHQRQFAWLEEACDVMGFLMSMPDAVREAHLDFPDGPTLYIERLVTWLDEHLAPDAFTCSTEQAAYVLWGVSHAFFLRWLHGGAKTSLVDQAGEMVQTFLRGVGGDA